MEGKLEYADSDAILFFAQDGLRTLEERARFVEEFNRAEPFVLSGRIDISLPPVQGSGALSVRPGDERLSVQAVNEVKVTFYELSRGNRKRIRNAFFGQRVERFVLKPKESPSEFRFEGYVTAVKQFVRDGPFVIKVLIARH